MRCFRAFNETPPGISVMKLTSRNQSLDYNCSTPHELYTGFALFSILGFCSRRFTSMYWVFSLSLELLPSECPSANQRNLKIRVYRSHKSTKTVNITAPKQSMAIPWTYLWDVASSLRWRHNECDSVSNHQPHGCLLNRLSGRRSK